MLFIVNVKGFSGCFDLVEGVKDVVDVGFEICFFGINILYLLDGILIGWE